MGRFHRFDAPSPDFRDSSPYVAHSRRRFQPVEILTEPPVADLLEAEYPLDHSDRMLHLRTNPGFIR